MMQSLLAALTWEWFIAEVQRPLVVFGFAGQFVFMLRFVVQWLVSERRGKSHVPIAFWYLSLAGGVMLLAYALLKKDLVFTAGQSLGLLIYVRNLMLIHRRQSRARTRRERAHSVAPVGAVAEQVHTVRSTTG